MVYRILEELPEDSELDIVPSEYWILNCFFIVLKGNDNIYLPLTYPIYKITKSGSIEGGLWTPPYVAKKLEGSIKRLNTPKSIKNSISNYIQNNSETIKNDISYMFYYLGIQNYELVKFSDFTEYKSSYSEPTKVKCYHIINHLVTDIDKAGIVNIVDPDCLRNLHLLNMSLSTNQLPIRENESFPSYNGKILASNLYRVISNYSHKLMDEKYFNIVEESFLFDRFDGVLFSYDINSSGKIRNKIEYNYASLSQNGLEISEDFISKLLIIFTKILAKNSIYQYRLEGDGFIAAIPKRDFYLFNFNENSIDPSLLLQLFNSIDNEIKKLLRASNINLSSKAAIHYGEYKYGKIGGIEARTTTFSGKDLFILSRLRDGITKWNTSKKNNISTCCILEDTTNVKFDDKKLIDLYEINVKESKVRIKIFTR